MTANQERFLKLAEVQRLLGVSRTTLWRWTAEHGLKVVRVGDVVRVRETDLHAFLKRHETGVVCADLSQSASAASQSA